ncbi:hypothetical protein BCR36DRAFT_580625 [Piromyces finnis]|uniref:Uncharacterized protein n=1 Tax=Piromyces finnis TaxID=1754191 RepID=A0A1Y1VII4_9FUNG|nr:hypothetical protein BCR36DRAFT_580625 [Piromyces finnis]|eukprot:ORX57217.1 hypothetical protein BCR36DRAFT_580625 [Piromyces finnis]
MVLFQEYQDFVPNDFRFVDHSAMDIEEKYEDKSNTENNKLDINHIFEDVIPSKIDELLNKKPNVENKIDHNLLNVQNINTQQFQPNHLAKTTFKVTTPTRTRTYTRTYTKTIVPTHSNSNSNSKVQNTKTIPPQSININSVVNSNNNNNQGNSNSQPSEGFIYEGLNNGINKEQNIITDVKEDVNQNGNDIEATIVPNAADYGYFANSNTIEQDINQIEVNSSEEKSGSNYTFIIILITIPILIIFGIAIFYFVKKYKNGKRGSNIVYPDDKIRKSNLFGTLQFWNANKPNHVSISSGSHGSRGSRTNLTSLSNDRESNVPEYSEWLEAGSNNTLSMPPVSPPPLVTDDKVNGLTGSNYAMGVNINDVNANNNGTLTSAQINKPQAARMAWKLEGMRVGRDSTTSRRKSERQSLFSSFQVW